MQARTLAALIIGAAALTACASGGRGPGAEPLRALISTDALLFIGFDTDFDLRVTEEELTAGIEREWTRADANRDGSLQPIEYQNWSNAALGGGQLPPYRLDFDRNVDNVITADEFRTELNARADDYDADGDGVLVRGDLIRTVNQTRRPAPMPDGGEDRRRRRE